MSLTDFKTCCILYINMYVYKGILFFKQTGTCQVSRHVCECYTVYLYIYINGFGFALVERKCTKQTEVDAWTLVFSTHYMCTYSGTLVQIP